MGALISAHVLGTKGRSAGIGRNGSTRIAMEELIGRVATAADIPADQAQRAINLVFAFLKKEAPAEAGEMLQQVPGAPEAAEAGAADTPKAGGMMGGLMNMMGGGGIMGLASQLTGIGLGTGEMTTVGKEIFAFAREKVGEERVGQVAAAIPGLGQFI